MGWHWTPGREPSRTPLEKHTLQVAGSEQRRGVSRAATPREVPREATLPPGVHRRRVPRSPDTSLRCAGPGFLPVDRCYGTVVDMSDVEHEYTRYFSEMAVELACSPSWNEGVESRRALSGLILGA